MEAVDVEAEVGGVADEVAGREVVLVREQQVVHLPEPALRRRRLGSLGGELRGRVHVGQRQVPPDEPQVGVARAGPAPPARPGRSRGTRSRRTR